MISESMGARMKKIAFAKLAASSLVLGASMVGMAGQAAGPAPTSATMSAAKAVSAAKQAIKALAKRKADKAVGYAEIAVANAPRDAQYRMLLGQAYLAAGRFQSAEQSFTDTLTLNPELERAALNLALAQTALGKREAARSTLADYRDKLAAADYGLALALAGDAEEAVRVLEFATRAPDASAKTRQNLALAYAFAGKWQNAKVMAIQDLTPDEADARISQWAMLVRPNAAHDQVAAVLGVTPRADSGQPTRLALVSPVAPVQAAAVEPAPAPVVEAPVAPAPAAAVAAVEPQPVFETPAAPVAAPIVAAPVIKAAPTPIREAVLQPSKAAVRAPVAKPAATAAA
jgi:Flp pilus assembly protein TadD